MQQNSVEKRLTLKEIQETNSFLRERFLYLIASMSGKNPVKESQRMCNRVVFFFQMKLVRYGCTMIQKLKETSERSI